MVHDGEFSDLSAPVSGHRDKFFSSCLGLSEVFLRIVYTCLFGVRGISFLSCLGFSGTAISRRFQTICFFSL